MSIGNYTEKYHLQNYNGNNSITVVIFVFTGRAFTFCYVVKGAGNGTDMSGDRLVPECG